MTVRDGSSRQGGRPSNTGVLLTLLSQLPELTHPTLLSQSVPKQPFTYIWPA